jgi:hypothetical protein
MSLDDMPEMLRVEEAAKVLRIGRSAAYEAVAVFQATGGGSCWDRPAMQASLRSTPATSRAQRSSVPGTPDTCGRHLSMAKLKVEPSYWKYSFFAGSRVGSSERSQWPSSGIGPSLTHPGQHRPRCPGRGRVVGGSPGQDGRGVGIHGARILPGP